MEKQVIRQKINKKQREKRRKGNKTKVKKIYIKVDKEMQRISDNLNRIEKARKIMKACDID